MCRTVKVMTKGATVTWGHCFRWKQDMGLLHFKHAKNLSPAQLIFPTHTHKKCLLRVTEQEPNICLSGNSHERLPLLIPLTFTEQRGE